MLLSILTFLIILLVYLHIYNQYKINNALDYYEIETPTKGALLNICNLKQPFSFIRPNLNNEDLTDYLKPKFFNACNKNKMDSTIQYDITDYNFIIRKERDDEMLRSYDPFNEPINIILIPPVYKNDLKCKLDYKLMRGISEYDIWNNKLNTIKYINIKLSKDKILFLPPYWMYAINQTDKDKCEILNFSTYPNLLSHIPYYVLKLVHESNSSFKFI